MRLLPGTARSERNAIMREEAAGGEAGANPRARMSIMYFKQILDERCGCASYVIAARSERGGRR